jgi:molybdopterin/thiamine biosynthesis adenylyltransferase
VKDKHVYVVGAGALGSHICDGLVRAGLGRLSIRDNQLLTPGNMTRHFVANLAYAGHNKAQVLHHVLDSAPYSRTQIQSDRTALISPAEAMRLLSGYDLVVDATADGSVTCMLEAAAAVTGNRFATACLQNDGRSMRIDVIPPLDSAAPLPPTDVRPSTAPEAFEAGCGEPVSATPPHAVAEAASIAVRHIVGMLSGNPEAPAGEHRDLG